MSKKISLNRVLLFFSFLVSFLGLLFSIFYKFSSASSLISSEMTRDTTLLVVSTVSILMYSFLIFRKKEILLPESKWVKVLLFSFPVLVLLSSFFSGSVFTSLFGKYVYLQSGITYLAIFALVLIVASYAKNFKIGRAHV